MSDRDHNDDTDFDDKTAMRQQPNDDKTAVRKADEQKSEEEAEAGSGDATQVRGDEPSADSGTRDATLIKDDPATPSGQESKGPNPASSENAAILRSSGADSNEGLSNESATILRGAGAVSNDSATIMRGASSNEHATILRGGGQNAESTVLRGGQAAEGDATVTRDGGSAGNDDSTIMNPDRDDDSTVLGGRGRGEDTTYVASGGGERTEKSRGSSEAGRLLKNRFVLEEKVGSGGMGDVYKALDLRQQEAQERNPYIAIKILNDEFARHKDAFMSLQREATRTRGIPHPNIMAVYDFDREGETVFMSMELLDGKPLDDYLRDHPEGVSVEDAWSIIDGISQGLSRAHGAGIVHSDFKPGNIYYCGDKTAKVFDFGIARAVANPGDIKADGEKTVFDAGSLGALTPTYASYEMLVGKDPTKADDVYAVALVAYELFTGRHPYNRMPADKALERGLEPEPVPFLKRRHWRALKKGLALKAEDRYDSIDDFRTDIFSEDPPYFRYGAIAAVLVASISFGTYNFFYGGEEIPEEYTQLSSRLDGAKTVLRDELGALSESVEALQRGDVVTGEGPVRWNFQSEDWRNTLRVNLSRIRGLDLELSEKFSDYYEFGENSDPEVDAWKHRVLDAYLAEISHIRENADEVGEDAAEVPPDAERLQQLEVEQAQARAEAAELERAWSYLDEVKQHFAFDQNEIRNAESRLEVERTLANRDVEDVTEDIELEVARLEQQRAEELARQERERAEQRRNAIYLALREGEGMIGDVNPEPLREILKCKGDLTAQDLSDLDTVLNGPGQVTVEDYAEPLSHEGMRDTFPEQFEVDRPGIVTSLVGCISARIAVRDPDRAREVKSQILNEFPGEERIASIVIEDLDPCAKRNLEGRGSMNGSWCSDRLSVGGSGPELVVVPPPPGEQGKFAISRIEIKRSDYNRFCEETGCEPLSGPGTLPVTNIPLEQARAYTHWLSDQTGRSYRLPTADEWMYAARTNRNEPIDENINCTVDARGVRLGDKLLSTLSGRPNRWGLYNYVGNAREWVMAEDSVLAVGGAHTDPKSECTLDKQVAHPGDADPVTGFRIVRTVEG